MSNLPELYRTYEPTIYQPQTPAQPQIIHIHQAPTPDRTLQRVALGAGMGVGFATAAMYLGPILISFMAYTIVMMIVIFGGLIWLISAWKSKD